MKGLDMLKQYSSITIIFIPTLFAILILCSCNGKVKNKQPSLVNFNIASKTNEILVAYTNDHDSLWSNIEWVDEVKGIMKNLSNDHNIVLLFDSKDHTPNVTRVGMNYSLNYDQWMVSAYWKYPNGSMKFCYGGVKEDNNFKHCVDE